MHRDKAVAKSVEEESALCMKKNTSSTSEAVADASSDAWYVDSSTTTKAQCQLLYQLLYREERILSRDKEMARSERPVWLPK